MTIRDGVDLMKIVLGLVLAAALCVGGWLGYRYYTTNYTVTTDQTGSATAQVIAATVFARNDLRVSRLSGIVQGTAETSRLWGWLTSSQVVKAPFTVDYFMPLGALKLRDFRYDADREVVFVTAPDIVTDPANIDLARATLNQVRGAFVSRGAMIEMAPKVSASASRVAHQRAVEPKNVEKVRDHGRAALERLLSGAFRAARLPVRVEVRFADEPKPISDERWDLTRSIQDVLNNVP